MQARWPENDDERQAPDPQFHFEPFLSYRITCDFWLNLLLKPLIFHEMCEYLLTPSQPGPHGSLTEWCANTVMLPAWGAATHPLGMAGLGPAWASISPARANQRGLSGQSGWPLPRRQQRQCLGKPGGCRAESAADVTGPRLQSGSGSLCRAGPPLLSRPLERPQSKGLLRPRACGSTSGPPRRPPTSF